MLSYKQENDAVNATTITRSVNSGKNETGAVISLTKRVLHFIKLMVLWSMSILFVLTAIVIFYRIHTSRHCISRDISLILSFIIQKAENMG